MGDSLEKGTKTVTRSSVAMRTPETIACFTRPQLSGISVKLVQCDQIYESPTLNKTLHRRIQGGAWGARAPPRQPDRALVTWVP